MKSNFLYYMRGIFSDKLFFTLVIQNVLLVCGIFSIFLIDYYNSKNYLMIFPYFFLYKSLTMSCIPRVFVLRLEELVFLQYTSVVFYNLKQGQLGALVYSKYGFLKRESTTFLYFVSKRTYEGS